MTNAPAIRLRKDGSGLGSSPNRPSLSPGRVLEPPQGAAGLREAFLRRIARAFVIVALFSLNLSTASANEVSEYAHAQKCYHSLDKSKANDWGLCLHKFQKVAEKFPTADPGIKSLFSVAKLSEEKFRIFGDASDLERAVASYNEFLRKFPQNSMADDALFQIGILRFEKEGDKPKAEKALTALLQRYPKGDMARAAKAYLEKLKSVSSTQVPEKAVVVEPVSEPVITAKPEEEDLVRRGPVGLGSPPESHPSDVAKSSAGSFNVSTIVIDPGHGGEDPGAVGRKGTREAEVALQIARKVAFKLRKDLKIETHLTRTINRTLSLKEREAFAKKRKADLFISIHANANGSKNLGGVQTFYLNNATSEASRRLAARENKGARKPPDLPEKILSTLLQNANTDESRELAHAVQKSLVGRLKKKYSDVKDQKVDSALFYVLVGAKCPAILVETSYITNPLEETRLRDSDYQWAIAEGIAAGVKRHLENQKKLASSL